MNPRVSSYRGQWWLWRRRILRGDHPLPHLVSLAVIVTISATLWYGLIEGLISVARAL